MDPSVEESITISVVTQTTLTLPEVTAIKAMFKYHDTDVDGHLTRDQSNELFGELGYGKEEWASRRVPMEEFLLKCAEWKKEKVERAAAERAVGGEEEARNGHVFGIIDQPRTGVVDARKLAAFLKEIDEDILPERVQRIAELISTNDGEEFTEEDLRDYVRTNLGMS